MLIRTLTGEWKTHTHNVYTVHCSAYFSDQQKGAHTHGHTQDLQFFAIKGGYLGHEIVDTSF